MLKRIFLFGILFTMLTGAFAQPLEYQYFPFKKPHSAKGPDQLTEFGPFHAAPYVFKFDDLSNSEGFYGYRVDIEKGESALVKKVDIGMTDGTGQVIGVVRLEDRFAVAYYFEPKKSDKMEYRIASLDLRSMELLGPPTIVDELELKDGIPSNNRPMFFVSPNKKKMLFYFDGIMNKESSLVHLVVLNSELVVESKNLFDRPHYVEFNLPKYSRKIDLGNDGTVYVIMRGLKPDVGVYMNVTDMNKISTIKLHVFRGDKHAILPVPYDYREPSHARVEMSGNDYFIINLSEFDKTNIAGYKLLQSNEFEPFVLSGSLGDLTRLYGLSSGGWVYFSRTSRGLTLGKLRSDGEVLWNAHSDECRSNLYMMYEHGDELVFLMDISPKELDAFERTGILEHDNKNVTSEKVELPFYVRCNAERKFSMGPVTDRILGRRHYLDLSMYGTFVSGLFITPSYDKTRPGIVVSRLP